MGVYDEGFQVGIHLCHEVLMKVLFTEMDRKCVVQFESLSDVHVFQVSQNVFKLNVIDRFAHKRYVIGKFGENRYEDDYLFWNQIIQVLTKPWLNYLVKNIFL